MYLMKEKILLKKRNWISYFICNGHLNAEICYIKHMNWMLGILIVFSVVFLYLEYISLYNAKYLKFKSFSKFNENAENNEVAITMKKRLNKIRENCKKIKEKRPLLFRKIMKVRMPWMFFSSAYKFIYCQIPKVASSNWMEIMSQLEGNLHRNKAKNIHSVKLPVITSMKYPGFKAIFNRYRKFMVIREPFKRVVSAYKDKLLPFKNLNRTKFHRLAKFITYYYRSANSSNKNFFPSFEEFIAFITDAGAVATKYKPHYSEPRHWMPQTSLCYPCNIDYDYILELDRVAVESKYLFERLEVPENTTFPKSKRHLNQTYLFPAYDNETMEYFRSVSPNYIYALYRYYKKDYAVFGYKIPNLIHFWNFTDII